MFNDRKTEVWILYIGFGLDIKCHTVDMCTSAVGDVALSKYLMLLCRILSSNIMCLMSHDEGTIR